MPRNWNANDPSDLELELISQIRKFKGKLSRAEMARQMGRNYGSIWFVCKKFNLPYYGDTPGEYITPGFTGKQKFIRKIWTKLAKDQLKREIEAAKAEMTANPDISYKSKET